MLNKKQGFTLIELLVVVLIIGILAAVAVPKYQIAVEKSRATQALALLKSVYQAFETYHLANGTYPESFDELSVDIPWPSAAPLNNSHKDTRSDGNWSIALISDQSSRGVEVFRTSGAYNGAGFAMWDHFYNKIIPLRTPVCMEIRAVFSKTKGDYCVKLFQGKETNLINSLDQFILP